MEDHEIYELLGWGESEGKGEGKGEVAEIRRMAESIIEMCNKIGPVPEIAAPRGGPPSTVAPGGPDESDEPGGPDESDGSDGSDESDGLDESDDGEGLDSADWAFEFLSVMAGVNDPGLLRELVVGAGGGREYPGWATQRALADLEQIRETSPDSWREELESLCGRRPNSYELVQAALSELARRAEESEPETGSDSGSDSEPSASGEETDEELARREDLEGEMVTLWSMVSDAVEQLDDFERLPWEAEQAKEALRRAKGAVSEDLWRLAVEDGPAVDLPEAEMRRTIDALEELLGPLDGAVEELEQRRDRVDRKRRYVADMEDLLCPGDDARADEPQAKRRRVETAEAYGRLLGRIGPEDEDAPEDEVDDALAAAEGLFAEYLAAVRGAAGAAALEDHHCLRELRDEQESTDLVIPRPVFARLCDEILQRLTRDDDLHFGQEAYAALQAAAEDHITRALNSAGRAAIHAGRTRVDSRDLGQALAVREL